MSDRPIKQLVKSLPLDPALSPDPHQDSRFSLGTLELFCPCEDQQEGCQVDGSGANLKIVGLARIAAPSRIYLSKLVR